MFCTMKKVSGSPETLRLWQGIHSADTMVPVDRIYSGWDFCPPQRVFALNLLVLSQYHKQVSTGVGFILFSGAQ